MKYVLLELAERLFSDWPQLERELGELLGTVLPEEAVRRVTERARQVYANLHLPALIGSLDLETAAQVARYQTRSPDVQDALAKILAALVESLIALEKRERPAL